MTIVEQIWHQSHELQLIKNKLLELISVNQPICFFTLVKYANLSYRNTLFFVELLGREGIIETEKNRIILSEDNYVLSPSLHYFGRYKGEDIPWMSEVKDIAATFEQIVKMRPDPILLFGQRGISYESTLNRINYMLLRGDLYQKRIAFLGDNDLCSIAAAFLGKTKSLTVFDIDEQIIKFINNISNSYNLKIETVNYDCHDQIPEKYQNKFDIFWCDVFPTSNASFEMLFWQRGLSLIKEEGGGIGYTLSFPSHKRTSHFYQSQILTGELGFVITDIIPFFNNYVAIKGELTHQEELWLKRWSNSDKIIAHTKSLIRFEAIDRKKNVPDFYPEENLTEWVDSQCDNYLLLKMGVSNQINLALKSLKSNMRWQNVLQKLTNSYPPAGTLKINIHTFYRMITGITLTNRGYLELAKNEPSQIIEHFLQAGFIINNDEINSIALLCTGIPEDSPQIEQDGIIYDLYSLIRHFESYYR